MLQVIFVAKDWGWAKVLVGGAMTGMSVLAIIIALVLITNGKILAPWVLLLVGFYSLRLVFWK